MLLPTPILERESCRRIETLENTKHILNFDLLGDCDVERNMLPPHQVHELSVNY